jgi:hypothetical protein
MSDTPGSIGIDILSGLDEGQVLQRRTVGASCVLSIRVAQGLSGVLQAEILPHSATHEAVVQPEPQGGYSVKLSGLEPGGPFTLRLSKGTTVLERSFYVGDLWLLAGQSNMEGNGELSERAEPHPLVRCFTMARSWEMAREPLHIVGESPDSVHNGGAPLSPQDAEALRAKPMGRGAGLGLRFAKIMADETGLPQGLIPCAHGGTSMRQWSPGLASKGEASLYGSMLKTLRRLGQPLAGVLWYQGCDDAREAEEGQYVQRMVALVASLRDDLKQAGLPWLMAQIGRVTGRDWEVESWHRIQEKQRRLPEYIPYLDVCATADLELDDWIHLSGQAFDEPARRFA